MGGRAITVTIENSIRCARIEPVQTSELLLHPVRLRIVHAALDGMPFTTSDLCARLDDISQATIYRHVALLVEGGLVEVDSEQRVRGAVERRYRLQPARMAMSDDEVAAMSTDDHARGFTAAIAALLAEFNAYLGRDGANPQADSVSYKQFSLWLSEDEKAAFVEELSAAIRRRMRHEPSPERRRHMLSTIMFPTDVGT
jgi:DNA-binding transcriptional ArsR family regulator